MLAHNFRNEYEVAVDAFGELYTADNDDDGNRSCRTTWVMPGGNHGFFSADGSRAWQADRRPGLSTQEAHWHAADPASFRRAASTAAEGPRVSVSTRERSCPSVSRRCAQLRRGRACGLRPHAASGGSGSRSSRTC